MQELQPGWFDHTVVVLSPHLMQNFGLGHGSPHTEGQRCPHGSSLEQRSLHGSLLQGAPQGRSHAPCKQQQQNQIKGQRLPMRSILGRSSEELHAPCKDQQSSKGCPDGPINKTSHRKSRRRSQGRSHAPASNTNLNHTLVLRVHWL